MEPIMERRNERLLDVSGLAGVLSEMEANLREQRESLSDQSLKLIASENKASTKVSELRLEWSRSRMELMAQFESRIEEVSIELKETRDTLSKVRDDLLRRRVVQQLVQRAENLTQMQKQWAFERWQIKIHEEARQQRREELVRRVGQRVLWKSESLAMDKWKEETKRLKKLVRQREATAKLLRKSVIRRYGLRRAFRRWWLGGFYMANSSNDAHKARVAAAPFARHALILATGGDIEGALCAQNYAASVMARVFYFQAEAEREKEARRTQNKIDAIEKRFADKVIELERRIQAQSEERAQAADDFSLHLVPALNETIQKIESRLECTERLLKTFERQQHVLHKEQAEDIRANSRATLDALAAVETRVEARFQTAIEIAKTETQEALEASSEQSQAIADLVAETTRTTQHRLRSEKEARIHNTNALAVTLRATHQHIVEAQQIDKANIELKCEAMRKELDARIDRLNLMYQKAHDGSAEERPDPKGVAQSLFEPYEDMAWRERRVPPLPFALAVTAANHARQLARHAAATADLEELGRVAAFCSDSDRDEICVRREQIVNGFINDIEHECIKRRPNAGALRLEARARAIKRFERTAYAALSAFDQVIFQAPTLVGRKQALPPACVACNRPLPTKCARSTQQLEEDLTQQHTSNIPTTGPPLPRDRPTSAPPINKSSASLNLLKSRPLSSSSSKRAAAILKDSIPKVSASGAAALEDLFDIDDSPRCNRPEHNEDVPLFIIEEEAIKSGIPPRHTSTAKKSIFNKQQRLRSLQQAPSAR